MALWPVLMALLLVAITALAVWQQLRTAHRDNLEERLAAVGRLRQVQVQDWLQARLSEARFLAGSPLWAGLYTQAAGPLSTPGPAAPDGPTLVLQRAAVYARTTGYAGAMVFDAQARLLMADPAVTEAVSPALTADVRRALDDGQVRASGPHAGPAGAASAEMLLVLPLLATGRPAQGAVVLRAPLDRMLAPMLRDWTAPGTAGHTLLWYLQGGRWTGLEPGPMYGIARLQTLADGAPDRALTRLLRSGWPSGALMSATGPDGVPSYAVGFAVDGTTWWLEVGVPRAGADQPLRRSSVGLLIGTAVLMLGLLLLLRYWRQHQLLAQARVDSQAQQERLQSLALLEAVAEHSTDAIVAKDLQGRYLLFNRAASVLFGVSPTQVTGQDDRQFLPEAEAAQVRINDALVLAQDRVRSFEEALSTTQGVLTFLATKGPLRDRNGLLIGLFSISRDVTDQVRLRAQVLHQRDHLEELVTERTRKLSDANQALSEAEHLVRTVGDLLPGRLVYWDHDERCRYANRAWYSWYGETPESALGRRASELSIPHGDTGRAPLRQAALRGEQLVAERLEVLPGDRKTYHRVTYVPDRRGDQVVGITVMTLDITEEKAMLAALEQARDQAEAAARAKSAFLANMSHEIRTPLNAVIGLANLLHRDITDTQQRGRINRLSGAAQHLLQLINDVLDLSKIEAGKLALERVAFSVEALLVRALEMVGERARAKGLELVLDTDHLPARLVGDPTRLLQALLNLLSNAVKFTDSGWVRLRGELLTEVDGRLQVRFEVRDSGIGISAADQARLFEPFEQVDGGQRHREAGTGLGLALIRHLARMMDGEVGVASEPGQGSCFWFTAWLQAASPGAGAEAARGTLAIGLPQELVAQRLSVLLVDDLEESRMVLGERLHTLGLEVQACVSGDEAVARLGQRLAERAALPDLLLIDWQMPGLDGLATFKQLQARLGAALPPCVLVSAHDGDALAQQALAAGFAAVLPKPISPSSLHDVLLQVLRPGSSAAATAEPPGLAPPDASSDAEAQLLARHAGQLVLVVDDNPVNREVARAMLERVGLRVSEAEDGEQAVAEVGRQRPQLVLMDLQMPRMDGLEATRAIRALHGSQPPVLAMTAHAFGEDRSACLAAGMVGHVPKPVDPQVLFGALLRWLPAHLPPRAPVDGGATTPPAPAGGAGPEGAAPGQSEAAPPDPLMQRLALVRGLDAASLLARLGGQVPLMRIVLLRFVQQYGQGLPPLPPLPSGQDGGSAVASQAHSLRGAAATLGAVDLAEQARGLEALARSHAAGEALGAELQVVDAALRALVQQLVQALDGAP